MGLFESNIYLDNEITGTTANFSFIKLSGTNISDIFYSITNPNPDIYVTGVTFNSGSNLLTLSRNLGQPNLTTTIIATSSADTRVTGFTYNNANLLTLLQNMSQPPLTVTINSMTGLTINGNLSLNSLTATTITASIVNFNVGVTLSGSPIVNINDNLFHTFNNVIVKKNPGNSEFLTLNDAINSITGATDINRYVINVGPGIYTEPELTVPSYVSIVGSAIQTTTIEPDGNHHVFRLSNPTVELSFLGIYNAPTGFAGIFVDDCGDFTQVHKITFQDCDTNVLVQSNTQDTVFYGEYIDYNGAYTNGTKIISQNGFGSFANLENYYNIPTTTATTYGTYVSGSGASVNMLSAGNIGFGMSGYGLCLENGASAEIDSTYFENWNRAVCIENSGTSSNLNASSIVLIDNNYDLFVAHPSSNGSMRATIDTPNIFIHSAATFGISYLDRVNGNKKTVKLDSASANLIAGSSPTTVAATRSFLSSTGFMFVSYPGATASNNGCSFNFRIPNDYFSGGVFRVIYTTDTGTGNIKFQAIVTKTTIGGDMGTQTETGLSVVTSATTAYLTRQTSNIIPVTIFSPDDNISIRLYRLGNDAADTFTGIAYVPTLEFEYNANK